MKVLSKQFANVHNWLTDIFAISKIPLRNLSTKKGEKNKRRPRQRCHISKSMEVSSVAQNLIFYAQPFQNGGQLKIVLPNISKTVLKTNTVYVVLLMTNKISLLCCMLKDCRVNGEELF